MNIFKFVKSLLPNFKKEKVAEDARITLEELQNVVLPSLQNATILNKLQHPDSIEMDKQFKSILKTKGGLNLITTLIAELPKVIEFQVGLQDIIDKKFEKEIIIDGITVYKANVLQAQSLVSFVSRFTMSLLNYIYILETQAVGVVDDYVRDSISDGDIIIIKRDFSMYCNALSCVTKNRKELTEILNKIPDILVGQNPEIVAGMYGDGVLDPLQMSTASGFAKSPVFSIRMWFAEWQVNRYKKMQETKTILELRVLNFQKQSNRTPDPKLEELILRTQSRIDGLSNKMRKIEEGAGV